MGRFRDLWASGKFVLQAKKEESKFQEVEAVHLLQQMSPELGVSDSTKAIFDALKSRRGQETGRWLRDLAGDRPAQAPTAATATASANVFDETVAWMDALFKEFSDLVFEFNKTAIGTEYLVSYDSPVVKEKKSDEVWYKPVTKSYHGRLTTRQWSLIVRGEEKKISIVLLPAGMLLAYAGGQMSDEESAPFMEIVRSGDSGSWSIGGEVVQIAAVPHLAKELLGDLIRLSSGVMSESELFSHASGAPRLGGNLAVGYTAPPPQPSPVSPTDSDAHKRFDVESVTFHDACDVVDSIVEHELKQLYTRASQVQPGSTDATNVRKHISAVEAFRVKMMDAFTEYTRATQPLAAQDSDKAPPVVELLRFE